MIITCLIPTTNNTAFAEEAQKNYLQAFEQTNVLEDLKSSSSGGQAFDLTKYPFDETGMLHKTSLISFIEFGYSEKEELKDNYGLFVYVYNPQNLEFETASASNKIQLAVGYSDDGSPSDYEKFLLEFENKSEEKPYNNLFYKFKIVDHKSTDGKTIQERVSSSSLRRYDVSGFELLIKGKTNATDYTVGGTFKYSGFAKGFGSEEASTLFCAVEELETIELNVHSTSYRLDSASDKGAFHQHDIHSVYFAVDNSVLEAYGKLQKIKAEWYEYKTAPIVITNSQEAYAGLSAQIGKEITENDGKFNSNMDFGVIAGEHYYGYTIYDYAYNARYNKIGWGAKAETASEYLNALYYVFSTDGKSLSDFTLDGDDLKSYILNYNASFKLGKVNLKNNAISMDLFQEADKERTSGYNLHEIDAGDTFNLLAYDSNHNWFEKWKEFGFRAPSTDETLLNIQPIYKVAASDVRKSNSEISKNLLIDENDVLEFKDFFNTSTVAGKTVFLFRFANTDYYSAQGKIKKDTSELSDCTLNSETVFFDFDIIQLTFNREGTYTVIPVVSNPIDIIADITPPLEPTNNPWWKTLIYIALAVITAILILRFLPNIIEAIIVIIKWIFYIIALPFKAIAKLFKRRKKR